MNIETLLTIVQIDPPEVEVKLRCSLQKKISTKYY